MIPGHASVETLARCAAGALPDGMELLVLGHVARCARCRRILAQLGTLCGALFAECAEPCAPPDCARALSRLDAAAEAAAPTRPLPPALPPALAEAVAGRVPDVPWRGLAPGLETYRFEGVASGAIFLMRGAPGLRVPAHRHRGEEAVLVLEGAMEDRGALLRAGDFALNDEGAHAPEVHGDAPCICLMHLTAPIEFTGAG